MTSTALGKLSAGEVDGFELVYSHRGIVLYRGDAYDVIPTLPKDSVHLVVCDPPYGVEFQSNRRQERLDVIEGDDGSFDLPGFLAVCVGPLRRGRHLYVFHAAGSAPDFGDAPLTEPGQVVWDKETMGSGDLQAPFGPAHELIAFSTFEPSKANRGKGYGRLAARVRKASVVRCARATSGGGRSRHPNEKPVGLFRELIESSSCIGETVLDPCCGSGASLVAARLESRGMVAVEIDREKCATARERIAALDASLAGLNYLEAA